MSAVVFLQIGGKGFEQLEITSKSFFKSESPLKKILYTDQELVPDEILTTISKVRPWKVNIDSSTNADYGGSAFAYTILEKIRVMIQALKDEDWILFFDVDILAFGSFSDDLEYLLDRCGFVVSCEGIIVKSRQYCTGLLALKNSAETLQVLGEWELYHYNVLKNKEFLHDQQAFNRMMAEDPDLESYITTFPTGYTMPGWFFKLYTSYLHGLMPKFFQCNWVVGNKNKVKRLRHMSKIYNLTKRVG